MFDKMEETIKGVVLFHETLKALNVKHEILAFNEDAFDSDDRKHLTSLMKLFIMIIQPWKKVAHESCLYTHKMIIVMA